MRPITLVKRLRELFRHRAHSASDQRDEFAFHLDMETAENVRRGMSAGEARRAAMLRFGGVGRFDDEVRDARGVVSIDNFARDARFALRRIHRAPGFAIGVIATLGVGVGVAVGIGAIVWRVLLSDLPYHQPDRLVRVGFHTEGIGPATDQQSAATFFHFAKSSRSFTALGVYTPANSDGFNLTDRDMPERVTIASMSPAAYTSLGVRPIIGTLFEPGDSSWYRGRSPILISERLWRRRYGADPSILGRKIDINRGERFVLGVMPRSFAFPSPTVDIWYPSPTPVRNPDIINRAYGVIGRLRDGVSPEAAAAELNSLVPSLATRFPAITADMLERSHARATVTSLKAATVAAIRPQLILLGGLVVVVLLIATTNVVNLFLLRTERASQEIAIALSLGASRAALAQRFVIEGVVLGLASAVVALPAAAAALSTKFGFTEAEIPRLHEVSFTPAVVGFVIGGAGIIGALVGLTALTRTGMEGLFDRLRASRSTSSRTWRRTRNAMVSLQVALALALLIAAGLLGRSFWNLRHARIGFEPAGAITAQVSLPWGDDGYVSYERSAAFHARMMDRLRALPGVASVAVSLYTPLREHSLQSGLRLQPEAGSGRPPVTSSGNLATPGYFGVMGIPLKAGRTFQAGDVGGAPAIILSERLATNLFGTTSVVGRRVERLSTGRWPGPFTIVGVVGDVHGARIEDGYEPTAYFPLLRDGDGLPPDSSTIPYRSMDAEYVLRGPQLPSAPTLQAIAKNLDRRVPVSDVRPLSSVVDAATARVRLTLLLIAVAGGAALLLGVIGVFSVVSYAAAERVREFGIRLAVGASPGRVASIVLGDGMKLVALGVTAGLLSAWGATRFLRALLYEVQPTSMTEFAVATALLATVSLVAIVLPARRAARTDPALVLRGE